MVRGRYRLGLAGACVGLMACQGGDDESARMHSLCEGVPDCVMQVSASYAFLPGPAGYRLALTCPAQAPHLWGWEPERAEAVHIVQAVSPQAPPDPSFIVLPNPGTADDSDPSYGINMACSPMPFDRSRPVLTHQGQIRSPHGGPVGSPHQRYQREDLCHAVPGCELRRFDTTFEANAAALRNLQLSCPAPQPYVHDWGADYDGAMRLHWLGVDASGRQARLVLEKRQDLAIDSDLSITLACAPEPSLTPRSGPSLMASNPKSGP